MGLVCSRSSTVTLPAVERWSGAVGDGLREEGGALGRQATGRTLDFVVMWEGMEDSDQESF